MRWTDGFKWLGLVGVPVWVLFSGLMIHFRMPGTNLGYVVMCEVFTSLAGGTLSQVEVCAIQTSVDHGDIAVSLALVALCTSVGGAIGQTISGAIWTSILPGRLERYLPDDLKSQAALIYGDLNRQLGYEWGSAPREAIVRAYGDTQKYMLIASVAASAGSLLWVSMMKNMSLRRTQQGLGVVM